MPTYKALAIKHYDRDNPKNALVVIDKDLRDPKHGEVLVRMLLRPINPSDIFCLQGKYGGFLPGKDPSPPHSTPGLEGVGVVEKLGPDTGKRVSKGQRVVGAPWPSAEGEGTWQEYVYAKEEHLLPVADAVSDVDAAQFLVNPVTAYGFLEDLKVPKGEYLLQNAANSILGKELIAMARERGTKLINVVRRKEVVQELKDMGADIVINTSEEDLVGRVKEVTGGKGAWACINPVGGPPSRPIFKCVRDSGLVYIFSLFGDDVIVPMFDLHFRDITVRGFWLNKWLQSLPSDQDRKSALQAVMDMMAKGIVKPPPPSSYVPLEQVPEKGIDMAQAKSGRGGKVLIK